MMRLRTRAWQSDARACPAATTRVSLVSVPSSVSSSHETSQEGFASQHDVGMHDAQVPPSKRFDSTVTHTAPS